MLKYFFRKIISSNFSYKFRNFVNFRPNIYLRPVTYGCPISDFFYWINYDTFETEFSLMNISSHILPNLKQDDNVIFYIFDNKGALIKTYETLLKNLQIKKINFSDFNIIGFGSFYVFHRPKNIENLINLKTFISERGYVGYRRDKKIWNYMHGNHNAAYLSDDNKIISLTAYSFFANEYVPQLSFLDVNAFSLIFNNPMNKPIIFKIYTYDDNNNFKEKFSFKLKSLMTLKMNINSSYNVSYIKIKSKVIFCRPIIFKEYNTYFDIFHG